MASLVLGLLGFLAYLLYDVNSVTRKNALAHSLFAVGSVFLLAATAWDVAAAWNGGAFRTAWSWLLALCALAFGCILLYTLFFLCPLTRPTAAKTPLAGSMTGGCTLCAVIPACCGSFCFISAWGWPVCPGGCFFTA